jgi:hypothetical protein
MPYQFTRHYTREEAQALLPEIRLSLKRLQHLRTELVKREKRLDGLMAPGCDLGGDLVNGWIQVIADTQEILIEFHRREIQIKDLDRGLIDFPALMGGKEIFLCWEQGEQDIGFWHGLDAGYAGREPL